jgi:hypothetical protein
MYSDSTAFTPSVFHFTLFLLIYSSFSVFYPLLFLSTSPSLLVISSFFCSSVSHFPLSTVAHWTLQTDHAVTHTHVCTVLASKPREIWRHEERRPETRNRELRTSWTGWKGGSRWTSGKTHNFTCFSRWWWTVTSRPMSDMTPNVERKCNPLGVSPVFYGSRSPVHKPHIDISGHGTVQRVLKVSCMLVWIKCV